MSVQFSSTKHVNAAIPSSTTDSGFTGQRNWIETAASVAQSGGRGVISASLPLANPEQSENMGLRIFHNLRLSTLGVLPVLVGALSSLFRARAALQLQNLALRRQIGVLQRSVKKRPRLTAADHILWAWLCDVARLSSCRRRVCDTHSHSNWGEDGSL